MKQFKVWGELIEGETLKEAIENNFSMITAPLRIGNAAGYCLHEVWCAYDGDCKCVKLHIMATGSDGLVNYSPDNDPVREYVVDIEAAPEDCPERIDFELTEAKGFNPFDDDFVGNVGMCYGVAKALIDEIARNHCILRDDDLTTRVSSHYPTMSRIFPLKYIETCRKELARLRPKSDKETAQLMERLSEMTEIVINNPKANMTSDTIGFYKTRYYFETVGKITALAAIRKSKGMTQQQLADAAQLSLRQLQNYERNPRSSLSTAAKYVPARLAAALGVEVNDIMEYGQAKLVNKGG